MHLSLRDDVAEPGRDRQYRKPHNQVDDHPPLRRRRVVPTHARPLTERQPERPRRHGDAQGEECPEERKRLFAHDLLRPYGPYSSKRLKSSAAFVPPKPKLFESA